MKRFIRFEKWGMELCGELSGEQVTVYDGPFWLDGNPTDQIIDYADVNLMPPVIPTKIICVGLNYHAHVKESQSAVKPPERPLIFLKPPSSLVRHGGEIIYPPNVDRIDYEAELGVVIGRKGKAIPIEQAADFIFGYTCVNDVTARNLQPIDGQWTRAKGFDTFCPMGPEVVTGIDHTDLAVEAYLNGERKQLGRTSEMIFSIPYLIEYISNVMTLMPGDIISTGTPQGIEPMKKGDTIEVRIEQVGSLVNRVA